MEQQPSCFDDSLQGNDHGKLIGDEEDETNDDGPLLLASSSLTPENAAGSSTSSSDGESRRQTENATMSGVCNRTSDSTAHCQFFPEREESEYDDGGIIVDRRPRRTRAQHVRTTCRGGTSEHEGTSGGILGGSTEAETDDGGSLQLDNCDKLGTLGLVEGALLRMLGGADSPSLSHSLSQKSSHSLSYKDSPTLSRSLSYKDSPTLSRSLSYKDSPTLSQSLSHSLSQKSSHSLSIKDSPYLCYSLSQKFNVPESFLDEEDGKLVETDLLQRQSHPEENGEIAEASSGPDDHKERQLLSRLLDQVQTLRRENEKMEQHLMANKQPSFHWDGAGICASCVSKRSGRRADKRQSRNRVVNDENLRQTVETAAQVAKAAAQAAQAAALSVAKNSTAVELLLRNLSPSLSSSIAEHLERSVLTWSQNTRHTIVANDKSKEEGNTDAMKNKKIVKQNNTLHLVFGFALLSTLLWRYGVVTIGARFRDKLNNTLGFFRGWVTHGFKYDKKEPTALMDL